MDMPQEQAVWQLGIVNKPYWRYDPEILYWSTGFLSRSLADYALHQMTPQELRDDGFPPC